MQDFEEELKKYRFWNRVSITCIVSMVLGQILIIWITSKIANSIFENLAIVIFGLFLLFIFSFFKIKFFRCPKCNKLFCIKNWFSTPSAGRYCVHCGLSAYKKS